MKAVCDRDQMRDEMVLGDVVGENSLKMRHRLSIVEGLKLNLTSVRTQGQDTGKILLAIGAFLLP